MKVFAVFIFTLACVSANAIRSAQSSHQRGVASRIINGESAAEAEFPYLVSLSLSNTTHFWVCAGSIIDHTWILTAAHCLQNKHDVVITYGTTNRSKPLFTQHVARDKFIIHRGYNNITDNDIALIRTPHIDFSKLVDKVQLPSQSDSGKSFENAWVAAAGWGWTHDNGTDVNNLNYFEGRIMSNTDCLNYYSAVEITQNVLCVFGDATGICHGDSGGPLVLAYNNILVGIASFVAKNGCKIGWPSGFLRVAKYLDWIYQSTGIEHK